MRAEHKLMILNMTFSLYNKMLHICIMLERNHISLLIWYKTNQKRKIILEIDKTNPCLNIYIRFFYFKLKNII